MLYGAILTCLWNNVIQVLILIFLENALRHGNYHFVEVPSFRVLILIFLENALRLQSLDWLAMSMSPGLNPYFFGKCSTAFSMFCTIIRINKGLNPYFFGKCSTAVSWGRDCNLSYSVLILIFLENALRQGLKNVLTFCENNGLNPYFFGKCSTAWIKVKQSLWSQHSLNPYFFGKCSTATTSMLMCVNRSVLILIFLENALRRIQCRSVGNELELS